MGDPPHLHGLDTLETPERVDLQVDLAGVGSRVLAFVIDTVLLLAIILGLGLVLLLSAPVLGRWALVLWLLGNFVASWFYFALFEARWDGQTPGKRLLGLRVQKIGGYPIGWPEALLRNFLRPLVDLIALALPVGLVVMLFTRRHQRIGDLAAGTVVVRERPADVTRVSDLGYATAEAAASPRAGAPELEVEEFELLHDFLARRASLDEGSRGRIGRSLAAVLRERLALRGGLSETLRGLEGEAFLSRLDAEYRGAAHGAGSADGSAAVRHG